ncbi:MAG TPA: DUF4960 domain-containing protein [Saprospiraceae bacterium]|nr:DUF4960 domain-containing protein [Saprospiraceae bacterium]HPI06041.1 DUF4960 domain-containing protein [Saprospiraceae bacterium]
MMKNILAHYRSMIALALFALAISFSACKDDLLAGTDLDIDPNKTLLITDFIAPGAEEVIIDEEKRTVNVTFPCGTNLSAVTPMLAVSAGNATKPASGEVVNLSVPVTYTLVNGNLFSNWTVTASVRCITGFLSDAPTRQGIEEDDVKAAADWFFANYAEDVAKYVSFQDIKNGTVDLSQYKVLWFYYDRNDAFQLPADSQDPDVLNAIKNWYKAGGNLYLAGYANQYLWDLGRITDQYSRVIGGGGGFENGDTWTINTNIAKTHDQSVHPIYAGIPMNNVDGRKEFPVLGPGWREDHNYVIEKVPEYMVDMLGVPIDPTVGFNENPNVYNAFTSRNNAEWLGTWGGINDYFMTGIMELKPNSEFQGTAIFQGIGGIEYNQNNQGTINPEGLNVHQGNIDRLTKNTISYLSTK